jgi:hypothetical protein
MRSNLDEKLMKRMAIVHRKLSRGMETICSNATFTTDTKSVSKCTKDEESK